MFSINSCATKPSKDILVFIILHGKLNKKKKDVEKYIEKY
jgi:hypothetical protein